MRNETEMDQLISFHKTNKKNLGSNKKTTDYLIPQTKHAISVSCDVMTVPIKLSYVLPMTFKMSLTFEFFYD
jgi:hypothetical protein